MSEQQIEHPETVQPPAIDSPAIDSPAIDSPAIDSPGLDSSGLASLDPVSLKWRSLIERRRAHFIELYLTGRWKRYYEEEQFLTIFRETMTIADRWNEIAPKPGDGDLQQAS